MNLISGMLKIFGFESRNSIAFEVTFLKNLIFSRIYRFGRKPNKRYL